MNEREPTWVLGGSPRSDWAWSFGESNVWVHQVGAPTAFHRWMLTRFFGVRWKRAIGMGREA